MVTEYLKYDKYEMRCNKRMCNISLVILLLYVPMLFWLYWVKQNILLVCGSHFICWRWCRVKSLSLFTIYLLHCNLASLFSVLLYSNCFFWSPQWVPTDIFLSLWHVTLPILLFQHVSYRFTFFLIMKKYTCSLQKS